MELFKNSKINNEIDAYLFGLIYADGYITGKRYDRYYTLGITFSSKDEIHLHEINKHLHGNISNSIVFLKETKKNYKTTRLIKCSIDLVNTLIELGISPNKTHTHTKVWENVDSKLYNHFIRGFFDGDGTICMGKGDKKYRCGFVGKNEYLFEWLSITLSHNLNKNINYKLDKSSNCFRIQLSGNPSCKNFGTFLYKESTLFLKRKKDLFDSIPVKTKINF